MRAELRLAYCGLLLVTALAAPALPAQGLPAEDVALLLSAEDGGSLALESDAVVWSVAGDEAELRVSLELPVEGLASPGADEVELRWAVYVVDGGGAVVASRSRAVTAERDRLATSDSAGVRILESLEIPVIPVSVRMLVREGGSARFGLRTLAADPTARRPFVARRSAGWIELGAAASGTQPAALSTVRAGGELELMVPAGSDFESADWILRRRQEEGEPEDLSVTVSPAPPERRGDGGWRRLRATASAGIQGRYRLVRRADPEAGGPAVYVLPESTEEVVTWPHTAVADAHLTPREPRPQDLAPAGKGRVPDTAVRQRLHEGFAAFARDGAGPGTEALLGVIDEAWATAGSAGVRTVITEALAMSDAAVRAEPASLPAFLAAIEGLRERCNAQLRHSCSGGLRALSAELLRGVEEVAPDEASSMTDAWALLGWRAMARQAFGEAVDCLRRAVRLQPDRLEPRLVLAKVYEIAGDYRQSARVLEELLEIRPGLHAARLRLGVQQRRLGRDQAALQNLGAAAAAGPDWVRVVAAQELAALQRERDEAGQAEETLRQAIARFPDDEQLTLQLAALLDASGRLAAAAALLDELGAPDNRDRTPRNRYSRWPPRDLESARARLRKAGAARRPALASALQGVAP